MIGLANTTIRSMYSGIADRLCSLALANPTIVINMVYSVER